MATTTTTLGAAGIVGLVASLLPLILQYGPELVTEVTSLIKGSSNLNSTQLQSAITAALSDAATKDAAVLAG